MIFQPLVTGSSGCCFRVTSGDTTIFIDCGFRAMKSQRKPSDKNRNPQQWTTLQGAIDKYKPEAVFISHTHKDHLPDAAPKLLEENGIELHIPKVFGNSIYKDKDIDVHVRITTHDPYKFTFSFLIFSDDAVILVVPEGIPDGDSLHGIVFDFMYVEANHDASVLDVCKPYMDEMYHRRAGYHMNNTDASIFINKVYKETGHACPVMIGNISEKHNTPELAYSRIQKGYPGEILLAERLNATKEVVI